MKKILLYTGFAIMTLAACSKENVNESNIQSDIKGTYEFSIAVNAEEIGTKTSYEGEKTFSWSAGDQISVLFHDSDSNDKFYTLTAQSVNGKDATFSGTIDSGWEVGASDTGDKWALYPAGNHTYSATAPVFSIPAEVDFSATHFSANLPMYAIGEDDGSGNDFYAFKHVSNVGAYKFTFSNLDVSKVRLVVEQTGSYHLNGSFQMALVDSKYQFSPWSYSFSSEAAKIRTFTASVESKTASFYIPFKTWEKNFQPIITLYDALTGFTLGSWTASTQLPYTTGNVVVAKPFSAPGTGSALVSAYGINWGTVTCEAAGSTGNGIDAIRKIKATADANYVYVYLEILNDRLYSNSSYTYSNRSYLYIGDGTAGSTSNWTQDSQNKIEGWLKYNGTPCYINWANIIDNNRANGVVTGDIAYFEMAIQRSAVPCLQGSSSSVAYVGFMVTDTYHTGSTSGSRAENGYAPAKGGSMLEVALPAYVAP